MGILIGVELPPALTILQTLPDGQNCEMSSMSREERREHQVSTRNLIMDTQSEGSFPLPKVLMKPSLHLHCHHFPFLVSSMLGCNSQLPLCVPHRVDHSHELFFLFPLISPGFELLPDIAVYLYKILDA